METKSLFYRLFKIVHLFTPEQEHQALLKCDPNDQRDIFEFLKEFCYVEIPGEKSTTIAALTLLQLDKFKKISEITGIQYQIVDITDKAILDTLEPLITNDAAVINVVVTPYLQSILTIDIILDKMNIKGSFDKLSQLDIDTLRTLSYPKIKK